MSKVNYEEMTNKELQALIDDFELTVDAKIPGKPNKAELVATLVAFKKSQNAINGIEDDTEDEDENDELESTNVKKILQSVAQKDMPREKKKELQKADLLRKERVIIFDKQNTQTKVPAISVTWGNRLIGFYTDMIHLNGKPQYVRRGALANLKLATFTYSFQEEEFSPVQNITEERFEIKELDGLTEDEIENLAAQQKINKVYAR